MTKFVRLLVYSYLETNETTGLIAKTCKTERANLVGSGLANGNRRMNLLLPRECKMHNQLSRSTFSQFLGMAEEVVLVVQRDRCKVTFVP